MRFPVIHPVIFFRRLMWERPYRRIYSNWFSRFPGQRYQVGAPAQFRVFIHMVFSMLLLTAITAGCFAGGYVPLFMAAVALPIDYVVNWLPLHSLHMEGRLSARKFKQGMTT